MSALPQLNATHDPALRSWVASANAADSDFPIQNLPFGVFRTDGGEAPRCGVAIGDRILDLTRVGALFTGAAAAATRACAAPDLNALMALGPASASALRARLSQLLAANTANAGSKVGADGNAGTANATIRRQVEDALLPMIRCELLMPCRVSGFTDFFASVHHATNAGRLFRPDQPLLPNYKYVPVAYNGRANSVRVSGDGFARPRGQIRPAAAGEAPGFLPTERLDHEVELGILVGSPSTAGQPVSVATAWQHVFGFCLLNDWSARDIQAWEYQPLGPFLGKSFATSISPWIVTAEALAPFLGAVPARPAGDPPALAHLRDERDQAAGAVSIRIEALLSTARMRESGISPQRLSRSNTDTLYWTVAQMIAHHTSNGGALDTGDLLGTGTVSGADDSALGSLLEITVGGSRPLSLASGESRRFLDDGDEICLRGHCERPGQARIGFGECRATVNPAVAGT